jgi:hypothetical protein
MYWCGGLAACVDRTAREDAVLAATAMVLLLGHGQPGLPRAGATSFLPCCTFLC